MSTASVNYVYLESNPKSAYKQLFVKGTRIPARALYGWYACGEPMTADEIAADYNLPVEAVREAIAYCESNPSCARITLDRKHPWQPWASTIRTTTASPSR